MTGRLRLVCVLLVGLALCAPSVTQGATVREGIELLHQGKVKEAIVFLTEAAEARPEDGEMLAALGYALLRSGDYAEAETRLQAALRLTGERGDLHRLLAQIAAQQGDFPRAFAELEQALTLDPQDGEATRLKEKYAREWRIEAGMAKNFGGNFTVTFEGGGEALGREALAALEAAYVELGSRFQLWPEQKTEVILYGNRDFKTLTNAPDWSGGLFDGKIRVPVGGLEGMNERLRRILYHEYAHVLIRAIARNRVPLWLNEGLAQWAEAPQESGIGPQLHQRLAKGKDLLPFSRLEKSFDGLSAPEAALAYEESLSLTLFLIERYGEAQILALLHALGEGESFAEGGAEILAPWNGSVDGLVEAWQEALKKGQP